MGKFQDLTGMKFGRLTVIEQSADYISPKNRHEIRWLCKCDCNNKVIVRSSALKSGDTHSCGCLANEHRIKMGKNNKLYNDYKIMSNYVIIYTNNNYEIYVDLDDFDKVKHICWTFNNNYVIGKDNGKRVRLHRLIMNLSTGDNKLVDHINHNTRDNRKQNLRIVNSSQNAMNRVKRTNNTSGTVGVHYNKRDKVWQSTISIDKKRISLGYFSNKDDAIKARKQAENKYYGDYSYTNSQKIATNNIIGDETQ